MEQAIAAIDSLAEANGVKMETVVKKISIKAENVEKMKRFYPLFAPDAECSPKEADIIAFMTEKAFEWFISSGEVEKRVLEIATKKG